jgi:hypothetical protein
VKGRKDPGRTGNFEIVLDGKTIHAKSRGNAGTCSTHAERNAVFDAVRAALMQKGFPIPPRDEAPAASLGGKKGGCVVA